MVKHLNLTGRAIRGSDAQEQALMQCSLKSVIRSNEVFDSAATRRYENRRAVNFGVMGGNGRPSVTALEWATESSA